MRHLEPAGGVGGVRILLDPAAGAPGRWAASELCRCLAPLVGRAGTEAPPAGPRDPQHAKPPPQEPARNVEISQVRQVELAVLPAARDAYAILPTAGGVCITGSNPRSLVTGAFRWLETLGWGWYLPGAGGERAPDSPPAGPLGAIHSEAAFARRGLVFRPSPGLEEDWADYCARSGLNTLALHDTWEPARIEALRAALGRRGVDLEFEVHLLGHLLPREEFDRHPEWFRMDPEGRRTADGNLCPSHPEAVRVLSERAAVFVGAHRSDTGRYFLWADDGRPWCACPRCAGLSPSDQNLLVMNAVAGPLLRVDGSARLACLAYHNTLPAPAGVRPAENVFLEYAPIGRCWAHALDDPDCTVNAEHLARLRDQVEVFPAGERQVLEYWLDCSLFSRWQQPFVRMPDTDRVLPADLRCYRALGVDSVTTFAVGLEEGYCGQYANPSVYAYPRLLWNPGQDAQALRRRFCAGFLGDPELASFFEALDGIHGAAPHSQRHRVPDTGGALAAAVAGPARFGRQHLDEALTRCGEGPRRERVAGLREDLAGALALAERTAGRPLPEEI